VQSQSNPGLQGRAELDLNNISDGTIKYGAYDLPIKSVSTGADLGYTLVLFLNEPRETANVLNPQIPKLNLNNRDNNHEEEEKKMPGTPDGADKPDQDSLEDNKADDAFIPNEKQQFSDETYDKSDNIVVYVDYGRFLPENISISKVLITIVDVNNVVIVENEHAI